jgi:hypothetical protein
VASALFIGAAALHPTSRSNSLVASASSFGATRSRTGSLAAPRGYPDLTLHSLALSEVSVIKRSHLFVGGLAFAAAIGSSFAIGCGSSSSSTPTGDGGTTTTAGGDDSGTAGYTPTLPPSRPTATASGSDAWFAVSTLYIGTYKRGTTTSSSKAWQDFGFDVDARNTTAAQSAAAVDGPSSTANNTCYRLPGSSSNYLVDGPGGLDNNFGQFLVQTIKSLKSDAEDTINQSVQKGSFTLLLHLTNFDASGADNRSVPGELFIGNNVEGATGDAGSATPTFTTADKWFVNAASLSGGVGSLKDGDPLPAGAKANLQFPTGYISKGQWVSGDLGNGSIDLQIGISGTTIDIPISAGVVAMGTDGSNGTVAGAINSADFTSKLGPLAARFGICPDSPNYTTVVNSLTRSADVVTTGNPPHLQTPGSACDSISVGLGFVAKPTGTPDKVYVSPPPSGGSGSCGDAGSTGGTSDASASD